jgi:hypothetical protein
MKQARIITLIIASVVAVVTSCKDDSLELIPEWESAVHGKAAITSPNTDFQYNSPTTPVNVALQWISIDQKLTVTKVELYVLFDENYIDKDGNPAVASHGGTTGRLYQKLEGSAVPANRTDFAVALTQAGLYTLYQDATFDYGNGTVSVFNNPAAPQRDLAHRFYWEDDLSLRWEFTTDDGRVFKKWGVSVCTEFPNADCSVDFTVVCASKIQKPQGTWVFTLADNYGDGWQGGWIGVVVDGVEVKQVRIPDGGGSSGADTYTFPVTGATTLDFVWHLDTYQGEVEFIITSPSGNQVANYVGAPPAGPIKMDLCLE